MTRTKKILVTGGAGFIGSHTCEKLLSLGYQVCLVDNFTKSKHERQKRVNISSFSSYSNLAIIDGDLLDKETIEKIFKKQKIATILHLAAKADVPESIAHPTETFETNLLGATLLFEIAARHNVSHIVYSSSSLVYGKDAKVPMKEEDPCTNPTSPYAASMRAIELAAHAYFSNSGIPITGLRLFPVYGPRMRDNLIIPVLVRRINNGKPITIFGDGEQKRSYTYIDDVVGSIVAALEKHACLPASRQAKPNGYQLINLGHPTPISLFSLITLIEKVLGKKTKHVTKPERKEEIPLLYPDPDISQAKRLLDFSPKISLEEGMKRYIKWYMKYHNASSK